MDADDKMWGNLGCPSSEAGLAECVFSECDHDEAWARLLGRRAVQGREVRPSDATLDRYLWLAATQ